MNLKYSVEKKSDHLVLTFEGPFDASTIPEFTEVIIQVCRDRKPSRMLIDVHGVTGTLNTLERHGLGKIFSKKFLDGMRKGQLPYCRFVVLGNAPLIDPGQFGAMVANNRGATTKATTDADEALRWLLSDEE